MKLRVSRQREIIYNTVCAGKLHPTAETVYSLLKPESPGLSLGTVYRNLNLLAGNGMLRRITMPGLPDRFDGGLHPHYHALCECCGRFFDVDSDAFGDIKAAAEKSGNFTVTSFDLVFKVVCKKCEKKEQTA